MTCLTGGENNMRWKSIELGGKIYYISNYGAVKSKDKLIVLRCDKDGYRIFTAGEKGRRKAYKVHVLVAKLFVPGYKLSLEVNHKDFDRTNNYYKNLEWVTHQENVLYSKNNGRYKIDGLKTLNPNAKLLPKQVKEIKKLLSQGVMVSEIARRYGRGWQTINHIKQGSTWRNI